MVRVEPRPFDQSPRKNDAFTHSVTLPTKSLAFKIKLLVSKPQVLKNCPVLGFTSFWTVKSLLENARNLAEKFWRLFVFSSFVDHLKKNFEDLFLFWRTLAPVLDPWPRAFLSLSSIGSVLGRAVLDLEFFFVLDLEPCVLDDSTSDCGRLFPQKCLCYILRKLSNTYKKLKSENHSSVLILTAFLLVF